MRLILHEVQLWVPAPEGEGLSPAQAGQMTLGLPSPSPDPLPIVLGAVKQGIVSSVASLDKHIYSYFFSGWLAGAVTFGTVLFIACMSILIRASCGRVRVHHLAALREQAGSSPSSRNNKNHTPPRVPVVIIEPDASVEIAYPLESENKSSDAPSARTEAGGQEVPMRRTPSQIIPLADTEDIESFQDREVKETV